MKDYILKHWRGEHSLPRSFWVNTWLIDILFFVALGLSLTIIGYDEEVTHPVIQARIAIGITVVVLFLATWQFVGMWRCSTRYIRDATRSHFWPIIVKLIIVLNVIATISLYYESKDNIKNNLTMGFLPDKMGSWQVNLHEDSLQVEGNIGWGLAEKVENTLRINPQIQLIVLDSTGGWIREARELATIIRSHNLPTYVSTECLSACTIAFIAGNQRWKTETAKIAFHRYSFPLSSSTTQTPEITSQHDQDNLFFVQQGINSDFIQAVSIYLNENEWAHITNEGLYHNGIVHQIFDSEGEALFSTEAEANAYFSKNKD